MMLGLSDVALWVGLEAGGGRWDGGSILLSGGSLRCLCPDPEGIWLTSKACMHGLSSLTDFGWRSDRSGTQP
ncbi:hypothetical protein GOP47_0021416 [Adiantum capillus-veneris]|uniref:Uncharacterized protein n=1 Tax=Adiantum capillus-veneris TaxID=13818 RepID=A0A9D4U7B3_ADICA|nr:hypothetical protein GOP47_0021416 [Adiantum capillus-veneris]